MKVLQVFVLINGLTTMNAFQSVFRSSGRPAAAIAFEKSHQLLIRNLSYPNTNRLNCGNLIGTSSSHHFTRLYSSSASSETDVDEGDKPLDYTTTRYIAKRDEEEFFSDAEKDEDRILYPKGKPEGFYVIKQYNVPDEGFGDLAASNEAITEQEVERLGINGKNVTLPIALMILDKEAYPSFSRARKSCRKGYIMIHRGPLAVSEETGLESFDSEICIRGRVPDRVFPGDVIGYQVRLHGGFYPGFQTTKPPFDLPVVYEDDHFAIVNKPAGVVCYSQRKQSHGMMTVRAALPFVLKPPKRGTLAIIRRPVSVHRLDKPTSGLLLTAKTKPAMVELTRQFVDRRIRKSYTAIVNGIPSEPVETSISTEQALQLGVDVNADENVSWQHIDYTLDEKSAETVWRPLRYVKSLKANDNTVTLVELKPKTGRYHQLRRHMAWVRECPLVGDKAYDGGGAAMSLRGRGLFLCSNKVSLEHPYYNTEVGRKKWENLPEEEKYQNGMLRLSEDGEVVEVHASIDLPEKFESFMKNEESRFERLAAGDDLEAEDNLGAEDDLGEDDIGAEKLIE